MAWYTEQIFADFLNLNNNHVGAAKALSSIMDDNITLKMGSSVYQGSKDVLEYLEQTFRAISSERGFTAKPVITIDSEGNRKNAVALFSKLEDYISWLFRIRSSIETWRIVSIVAERPDDYDLYYDLYTEGDYDNEGNFLSQ